MIWSLIGSIGGKGAVTMYVYKVPKVLKLQPPLFRHPVETVKAGIDLGKRQRPLYKYIAHGLHEAGIIDAANLDVFYARTSRTLAEQL